MSPSILDLRILFFDVFLLCTKIIFEKIRDKIACEVFVAAKYQLIFIVVVTAFFLLRQKMFQNIEVVTLRREFDWKKIDI
jgi:hypothetical protein